jgi:hypothetical protein
MRSTLTLTVLLALSSTSALATDTLPQTFDFCPLSQSEFNGWFQSGTAAPNGIVKPANSITFVPTGNCSFYKWSEQMWLWTTSTAPAGYGGSGFVFTSPTFYDVSAQDPANGNMRHLVPHSGGLPIFANALERAGPESLPIKQDTSGNIHDVVFAPLAQDGNSLIRNADGKMIEIGRIDTSKKRGTAVFLDTAGKKIDAAAKLTYDLLPPTLTGPLNVYIQSQQKNHLKDAEAFRAKIVGALMISLNAAPVVEKFVAQGIPTFVDLTTNTVVPMLEMTQAFTNNVLVAQNNEIIYYGIHVNDVYAYYLKGRKTGLIAPPYMPGDTGQFPTTQGGFDAIQAAFPTKNFPDSVALAIEMKTAWINAASLPDPQDYIRRTVQVPVFNKSNPFVWTPAGTQTMQLALLSAHIVGSVAGHPEMFWSTFEHVNNSPHARYNWTTPGSVSVLEPFNTGPNTPPWVVYPNNGSPACPGTAACNVSQAQLDGNGNIVGATTTTPVLPANVMRIMAFGTPVNRQPNPFASPERSNDEVISLNNHVQAMLSDVRTKYVFTGSTWTLGGGAPTVPFMTGVATTAGTEVGTDAISNSLMETTFQGNTAVFGTTPGTNLNPTDCLGCHATNTTVISHIFYNTNPF